MTFIMLWLISLAVYAYLEDAGLASVGALLLFAAVIGFMGST